MQLGGTDRHVTVNLNDVNKLKSHFGEYARSYIDTSNVLEAHNSTAEWF